VKSNERTGYDPVQIGSKMLHSPLDLTDKIERVTEEIRSMIPRSNGMRARKSILENRLRLLKEGTDITGNIIHIRSIDVKNYLDGKEVI